MIPICLTIAVAMVFLFPCEFGFHSHPKHHNLPKKKRIPFTASAAIKIIHNCTKCGKKIKITHRI